jgi:non-homologous end joining protein Ku
MKAIWKGYLKSSLVTIPIKMFTVITERSLQFHLYHKTCCSRSNQENVCLIYEKTLDPARLFRLRLNCTVR